MVFGTLLGTLPLALGWVILYAGVVQYRTKMLIEDTPTSPVRAIALGPVEVKGTPEPTGSIHEAPFSKEDCVLYRYHVDRRSHGNNSSREWFPVEMGDKPSTFFLDDGTGQVLVDPAEAEVDMRRNTYELEAGEREPEEVVSFLEERDERIRNHQEMPTMANSVSTFLGDRERRFGDADDLIGDESSKRRYVEEYLPADEEVYVFGQAVPRHGVSSPDNPENVVIKDDERIPTFRISTDTEEELVERTGRDVWKTFALGAGVAGFGFLWLLLAGGGGLGTVLALMVSPISIGVAVVLNRFVDLGRIRIGSQ